MVGLLITACTVQSNKHPESSNVSRVHHSKPKKTLLIYYSLTKNTARLANTIGKQPGIESVEIKTKKSYPTTDNDQVNKLVKEKQNKHQFDQLKRVPKNLNQYQKIIIGFPIWSNDMAYPMQSFLAQNKETLSHKVIVPFTTSSMAEASAIRNTEATIRRLVPGVNLQKGLNLASSDLDSKRITSWINQTVLKTPSKKTAITIRTGSEVFKGYLNNSAAAKDFAKHLPQKLNVKNFATGYPEKYAKLPFKLRLNDTKGDDPGKGDLDYNSKNQSLFFYHGRVGKFQELHRIGHINDSKYINFVSSHQEPFEAQIELSN